MKGAYVCKVLISYNNANTSMNHYPKPLQYDVASASIHNTNKIKPTIASISVGLHQGIHKRHLCTIMQWVVETDWFTRTVGITAAAVGFITFALIPGGHV